MLEKDLLDLVYDLLSKELKDSSSSISYSQICELLKSKLSEKEIDNLLGSLYIDMLQDTRFVFIGNNKWTLRKLQNLEFLKNNQSVLYNYDNTVEIKENYDEDSLPSSMTDQENEIFEENDFEISRDSLENSNDDVLDSNLSDEEIKYEFDE